MIDPKTIELMNRVLDGAASEPERADLDRILTASPEARGHFDAMERIVRRLDSVPLDDPPATLHPRVMEAIDGAGVHRGSHAHGRPGFFSWFRPSLPSVPLRYASTFGLGLAAGALVLAIARGGPGVDPSQVAGTLARPAGEPIPVVVPDAGVSGSAAVVDRGVATEVRLRVDGGGTEWVIDVPDRAEPTHPVVIRVVKSGQTVFEQAIQPVEP